MTQKAPTWLEGLWAVVGILVLGLAFALLSVIVNYPLVSVPLIASGAGWIGYKIYTSRDGYKEKAAQRLNEELYQKALALVGAEPFLKYAEPYVFAEETVRDIPFGNRFPSFHVLSIMFDIADAIYQNEGFKASAIPKPPSIPHRIDGGRYRDQVNVLISKLYDPRTLPLMRQAIIESFGALYQFLPPLALQTLDELRAQDDDGRDFVVALVDILPNVGAAIDELVLPFYPDETRTLKLCAALRDQLDRNQQLMSVRSKTLIAPSAHPGTPHELVEGYLSATPFLKLFTAAIPFRLPFEARFEHMNVLAGSGHGKTQLLQSFILKDLRSSERPSVVVIDSQGSMIDKLARLGHPDTVLLDPKDIPALNLFAVPSAHVGQTRIQREQVYNHTLEVLNYLFNSLLGAELTTKQGALFNYLIMLMFAIPETMGRNATLLDLLNLTQDRKSYAQAIASLDDLPRSFFEREFFNSSYRQTREQIRYRLHAILSNTTLSRLFLSPHNRVDFFEALNTPGKLILIDTAKDYLGAKNSSYLGRIATTIILQAILSRAAIPEAQRNSTFLYIDEAGEYFDGSIEAFLTEARKQRAGLILSYQKLDDLKGSLLPSVLSNTSIKFAAGVSDRDARALGADMRTTQALFCRSRKGIRRPSLLVSSATSFAPQSH